MLRRLLAQCLVLLAASAAAGAEDRVADATPPDHPTVAQILNDNGCVPKDNMARVLKSANPLDNAPNWTGKNSIGTGYTFLPKRYVVTDAAGGIFLQGDLLTPRGAAMQQGVFILFAEWNCGRK